MENCSNRNFICCNFEQQSWGVAILKGSHFEGQPFWRAAILRGSHFERVLLGCISKIYKRFIVLQWMKMVFQVFEHISILKSFLDSRHFEMPTSWIKRIICAGPLAYIFQHKIWYNQWNFHAFITNPTLSLKSATNLLDFGFYVQIWKFYFEFLGEQQFFPLS